MAQGSQQGSQPIRRLNSRFSQLSRGHSQLSLQQLLEQLLVQQLVLQLVLQHEDSQQLLCRLRSLCPQLEWQLLQVVQQASWQQEPLLQQELLLQQLGAQGATVTGTRRQTLTHTVSGTHTLTCLHTVQDTFSVTV